MRSACIGLMLACALPAAGAPQDPESVPEALADEAPAAVGESPAPLIPQTPPQILGEAILIQPDPPPGTDVVLPPLVGSLGGCALVAAPLGTLGALSTVFGVSSILAFFGAGLLPQVAIPCFLASFCCGLPSFCLMGPASVGAAAGGAMIATRSTNDRSAWPAFVAMIPPLLLAVAGSALATFGLFYTFAAFLGASPGMGRAGLALLGVGLLTSLFAGPLTAFGATAADVAFGGPFVVEEGPAVSPASPPARKASRHALRTRRTAMVF